GARRWLGATPVALRGSSDLSIDLIETLTQVGDVGADCLGAGVLRAGAVQAGFQTEAARGQLPVQALTARQQARIDAGGAYIEALKVRERAGAGLLGSDQGASRQLGPLR